VPFPKQFPQGDCRGSTSHQQTLYWAIRQAQDVYGVQSFYITENGSAFDDKLDSNGEVLDLDRREYLRNYLISVHRAVDEGFDVRWLLSCGR
jgi:beta-glucosidase